MEENKMRTKEYIEKQTGQDKIRGRPIRLNRQSLALQQNKDYAKVTFWGDIHLGYPTCNLTKAKRALEWALDTKTYLLGMGD